MERLTCGEDAKNGSKRRCNGQERLQEACTWHQPDPKEVAKEDNTQVQEKTLGNAICYCVALSDECMPMKQSNLYYHWSLITILSYYTHI